MTHYNRLIIGGTRNSQDKTSISIDFRVYNNMNALPALFRGCTRSHLINMMEATRVVSSYIWIIDILMMRHTITATTTTTENLYITSTINYILSLPSIRFACELGSIVKLTTLRLHIINRKIEYVAMIRTGTRPCIIFFAYMRMRLCLL